VGTSSIEDNIEFDSTMEVNTYKLLRDSGKFKGILVHTPYSTLCNDTTLLYTADFVLNDYVVLEVSTFNPKHHPKYFNRIYTKQALIEQTKYKFVFCKTLAEVKAFIKLFKI
jgi:hypothetical protein